MPETRNLEIADYSIEVSCDDCREEADVCLCQSHYEEKLAEEFEKGREAGKAEAEEEFKKSDEE